MQARSSMEIQIQAHQVFFLLLYFIQREAGLETEMTKFIMIAHQKATLMMCQMVTTYRHQIQQTPMQAQSSMKIQSQAH